MVSYKKALKKLWKDTFTVIEYQEAVNPNGTTGFEEVEVLRDEPCKLSYSTLREAAQGEEEAKIIQVTKIFCDKTLIINAGSKIIINRDGRVFEYSQSGEPGIFSSHQEIMLVPFRGWA